MNDLSKLLLSRGLQVNRRMAQAAGNSMDWLFKRDTLIKSGRTWFELVHDSDLMAVRYYELPDEDEIELQDGSTLPIRRKQHAVPLVLIPPLGVTTETFDLMPQRSLVRYMVASGFRVYLVDWGKPTRKHSHLGLADYSRDMMGEALEKVREHAGCGDVSLMGWCMGGLFCLLYQGQTQDRRVRNIVTVASPIDLESGSGVIAGVASVAQALEGPGQLAGKYSNLLLDTLDPALLSTPPWLTTLVFKLTDPLSSVTTYWDLMANLYDREFVESHSTTSDYLNNMLLYPGGVLKDMAIKVVGGNQLAGGRVEFGDSVAELDRIRCNFLGFAGEGDKLVPSEVAERIVDVIASQDREFRIAPGGHMGVIIGSKAVSAVWAESVDWLAQRSAARPQKRAPASSRRKSTRKPNTNAKAKAKTKAKAKAKTKAKA
ncbi:MAG: alpha/beta fold hydrolase [Halioglobus sp.]|nr:alpha/beta fold hydrolase [Halioglobus sp.]